jgi:hypothetical protein
MRQKTPRPGARSGARGAGDRTVLGGIYDPKINLPTVSQQGPASPSSTQVPLAFTRIVVGRTHAFIYIEYCPLCGLEHMHGQFPHEQSPHQACELILRAYENPGRASHCRAHGLGRILKQVKGGRWVIVERAPPPEYREPTGHSYRLLLGPKPACFTPSGARNRSARLVMAELARQGVPTSNEVICPRRRFVLRRGDVRRPCGRGGNRA